MGRETEWHFPKTCENCERVEARIKALEDALDGLFDGLDANADDREGLTNVQWQRRIAQAHKALEVKS